MQVEAPAKLNLRLVVLAREESGYHQIETIFCALQLADQIDIERAERYSLTVSGADVGPVDSNLVTRAVRAFAAATATTDAYAIRLTKCIPFGAGLGGGSSDAAATLHALNTLNGAPLDADAILLLAARLGSDVPFFAVRTPCALGYGRGDRIVPLHAPAVRDVLLAAPRAGMPTAAAYASLAASRGERAIGAARLDLAGPLDWPRLAELARNDFTDSVAHALPLTAELTHELAEQGARIAMLTGSGSAVFGIFDDEAAIDRAHDDLARRFPDVKLIRTRTRAIPFG